MTTMSKNGIYKQKTYIAILSLSSNIPTYFSQAIKDSNWRKAMVEEYNASITTKIWTFVPPTPSQHILRCKGVLNLYEIVMALLLSTKLGLLQRDITNKKELITKKPFALLLNQSQSELFSLLLVSPTPSQHIIGCKYGFKLQKNPDGSTDKYKARLVAKGYRQQGVDYQETFSTIIKLVTIKIILSLALYCNWLIKQLDVSNVFLHRTLQEQVFMQQLPCFTDQNHPHYVCKLHKYLYGLK